MKRLLGAIVMYIPEAAVVIEKTPDDDDKTAPMVEVSHEAPVEITVSPRSIYPSIDVTVRIGSVTDQLPVIDAA